MITPELLWGILWVNKGLAFEKILKGQAFNANSV